MRVAVNGDDTELRDGANVTALLDVLGLGGKWVLVERNGEAVHRNDFDATALADGDRIELVRAVAGG